MAAILGASRRTTSTATFLRELQRRRSASVAEGNELPVEILTGLRSVHAAEDMLHQFMQGQEWAFCRRVDAQLEDMRRHHDAPTSRLLPFFRPLGFLSGVAVSCAPRAARMAVYGALQDAISDEYNDHIRTLLEQCRTDRHARLKELFVSLRDEVRVPEGAVPPPDLANLQKIEELSLSQGLGAAVKGICRLTQQLLTKL